MSELLEGVLDSAQCDDLFSDIASCTEVTHVQVRLSTSADNGIGRAVDRSTTLEEARQLLREGAASMVQIRYRYQQAPWCDTLLVGSTDMRLVRMQQKSHTTTTGESP